MKSLFVIFGLLIACSSLANSSFGTREVTKLVFHDSGNLYVYFSGAYSHGENCISKSTYVLPHANPFFKEIYSGLLAAMHAKTKVSGWVNGCVVVWSSSSARITRVDFHAR